MQLVVAYTISYVCNYYPSNLHIGSSTNRVNAGINEKVLIQYHHSIDTL
jgi:hypothetical protein